MTRKPPAKGLKNLDVTVVSEVFTRRVAVLAISGHTSAEISSEMGLSAVAIKDIQAGALYKKYVSRIGEQEMLFAVSRFKTRLAEMGEDATKVYAKVMRDYLRGQGSARDAVTVSQSISRSLGVDKGNDTPHDTKLTIVLPGGSEIITFPGEKVQNDDET